MKTLISLLAPILGKLGKINWRQSWRIIAAAWTAAAELEDVDMPGKEKLGKVMNIVFELIPEDRWLVAEEITRWAVESYLLWSRLTTLLKK